MKTIVLNIQGPSHPRTTYYTLEEFHALPRRTKKTILKKSNVVVPAEKMTELVKGYPKEIGYRKCHTCITPKITSTTLDDFSRYINLNIKKNQLKVHIGSTSEKIAAIHDRAKSVISLVKTEGYDVLGGHISKTHKIVK